MRHDGSQLATNVGTELRTVPLHGPYNAGGASVPLPAPGNGTKSMQVTTGRDRRSARFRCSIPLIEPFATGKVRRLSSPTSTGARRMAKTWENYECEFFTGNTTNTRGDSKYKVIMETPNDDDITIAGVNGDKILVNVNRGPMEPITAECTRKPANGLSTFDFVNNNGVLRDIHVGHEVKLLSLGKPRRKTIG
jgi:hypothetical protein